ncbi:MAG TPA: ATP-grasp domain-containing protein [Gaiella sp.]
MSAVLFVGAERDQRAAIVQTRGLGHRVVAVDDDPDAPGLAHADVAEVADIDDPGAIESLARRHAVDAVLTIARDRAVPVVAAVAERLGRPSLGADVAHRFTHKLAMRRTLAEEGLPQPAFAAVRNLAEGRAAIDTVGLPAVLKPADAEGQRGLFRIEEPGDLESHLHAALAESRSQEALLERLVEGTEMNGVVVALRGTASLVMLSDRLRPDVIGFGVARAHVHPARIHSDQLASAERTAERVATVLGLRDGIGVVQLVATTDGGVSVLGAAARVPGGRLAELVRLAVGIDLVELALRFALGENVADVDARARTSEPTAIRYLTAAPGQLVMGSVARVGALGPALSAQGVVEAETYLAPGDVIRPLRTAADRYGHVIATGPTTVEALDNADRGAALVSVEVG